jgi:hypothetical protein
MGHAMAIGQAPSDNKSEAGQQNSDQSHDQSGVPGRDLGAGQHTTSTRWRPAGANFSSLNVIELNTAQVIFQVVIRELDGTMEHAMAIGRAPLVLGTFKIATRPSAWARRPKRKPQPGEDTALFTESDGVQRALIALAMCNVTSVLTYLRVQSSTWSRTPLCAPRPAVCWLPTVWHLSPHFEVRESPRTTCLP